MQLHLVGGFLGSGKTTAILGAARLLTASGKRVGVVTNDQGRYLVDTALFRPAMATAEVTGGCFCCNYADLQACLDQLKESAAPDVIFAESVGSCADLVATVLKPLLRLNNVENPPTSFSVFADARLLQMRLLGEPLPFNEDVIYIFDQQLEEAGVLVINKVDLLSLQAKDSLAPLAKNRFEGKTILLQNSLDPASLARWIELVNSGGAALPLQSLQIDYQRYGAGEARLAWLDEEITLNLPEGQGRAAVLSLLEAIIHELKVKGAAVGHLKTLLRSGSVEVKVSFPTLPEAGWQERVPDLPGRIVNLMLNARVEMDAEALRQFVRRALNETAAAHDASFTENGVAYFHPSFPKPTHRIS